MYDGIESLYENNLPLANRHALDYERLTFRGRIAEHLKWHPNHPIAAIDTETYGGKVKLIADNDGDYLLDPSIDAILSFLTRRKFRSKHIFVYNLGFDNDAIFAMLPDKNMTELLNTGVTKYITYRIKSIPKKLLSIRDKHENTSLFYDLAQFYELTLDGALEKYLGLHKTDFPYRNTMNDDIAVWNEHISEIIPYCISDAQNTALLGELLQDNVKTLFAFNPKGYISRASLAKELVRLKGYVPSIRAIPYEALKFAFYAYKGGRFEAVKRGHFPHAELYDINSAYPFVIRDLIDVSRGEWRHTKIMSPNAYYGFYLCRVFVMPYHLCPIAYILQNGLITFPAWGWKTYLTKEEVLAYRKYADIEVIRGWEYFPTEIRYPFKRYIESLHAEKQRLDKKDYKYDLVKRMMNALYGSFYEKRVSEEEVKTGKLFNPIYASEITALTRIKVFEEAKRHEKRVIAMATDSLLLEGKNRVETSKELGEWDKETEGETVVIRTGVYQIGEKTRIRGFTRKKAITYEGKQYPDLFAMIRENPEPTEYITTSERPIHFREAMIHTKLYNKDDINVWHTVEKTENINKEIKRRWLGIFKNGGEIFEKSINSEPWRINKRIVT